MNCVIPLTVAPLMLVASTLTSLGQSCPVFNSKPDHYDCSTYGPNSKTAIGSPYPMRLTAGTVNGVPSYVIEISGVPQTVVVGRPIQKNANESIYTSCRPVESFETKQMFDTMIMRTRDLAGQLIQETHVRSQGDSMVLLEFGPGGPDGGPKSRTVCRPNYTRPAAPSGGATSKLPAR